MHLNISHIGSDWGDGNRKFQGASDVELFVNNGLTYAAVSFEGYAGLATYRFNLDGSISRTGNRIGSYDPDLVTLFGDIELLNFNGNLYALPTFKYSDGLAFHFINATGAISTMTEVIAPLDAMTNVSEIESFTFNGSEYSLVSNRNKSGFSIVELQGLQNSMLLQTINDSASNHLGDVVDFSVTEFGGDAYLFSVSAFDGGVSVFKMNGAGQVVELGSDGPDDGPGFWLPSTVESVSIGNNIFAVVGASGSSSLTVYRVNGNYLELVDHYVDDLNTRFENIQVVKIIEHNGRVIVVTGGSDAGISLFELSHDGKLTFLENVLDELDTALGTITDFELMDKGDSFDIVIISSEDGGMTLLNVELSNTGEIIIGTSGRDTLTGGNLDDEIFGGGGRDILIGGNGDDRLIDGQGHDELTGGSGADVFVFVPDVRRDVITDFEIGIDKIDLSSYQHIGHVDSLEIIARQDGAVIIINDDVIVIKSDDGERITKDEFTNDMFIF